MDVETSSVASNEVNNLPDEAISKETKTVMNSTKDNELCPQPQLDKKVPLLAESEVVVGPTLSRTNSVVELPEVENRIETDLEHKSSESQPQIMSNDEKTITNKDTSNTEDTLSVHSIDQNDSSVVDSDIEAKLTDVESIILAHESLLEMGRKVGIVLY